MDKFDQLATSLESPARNATPISPDDGQALTVATRALWIGGQGDINVRLVSGDIATFKNASGWMPIRASQILAANTTATDIIGVW